MVLEGISGVVLFWDFNKSFLVDILLGQLCKTAFSGYVHKFKTQIGPCITEVTLQGAPTFKAAQILSHFGTRIIMLSKTRASSTPCHRRHEKATTMGVEEVGDKNAHFDHVLY